MNEYTPTTEQVRDVWIDRDGDNRPFDRWLAVEIRKAKAEALREAAPDLNCRDDYELLRDSADRIERGDA